MAIAFNCPHCGELHRVKDELAGRTGKCKSAKCRQPILIPFRSTVSANGAALSAAPGATDAEAMAAAALAEEAQPKKEVAAPTASINVECPNCMEKFDTDAAMAGKNVRCTACGKIVRVPLPKSDKPLDWRQANEGRPSMAKVEAAPEGAWEVQRKGVSGQAIREAGAHEVEDEDDIRERKIRRIKQLLYGLALLGMVAFVVIWIARSRTERKQERWMEQAVQEIEDKNEGSNRPEYQAAIHRYALVYFVRAAKQREELDAAAKHFDKALSGLQGSSSASDRDAMLAELSLAVVDCSGDQKEIDEERRLPWDRLQKMMRQSLEKIPAATPAQRILRQRAFRMLARKLAEKEQPLLALTIANSACSEDEKGNIAGRIGIEFVLMGKRDAAQQVLSKSLGNKPEMTALWMGLSAEGDRPPAGLVVAPPVGKIKGPVPRDTRLAYAEGTALRGDLAAAWKIAVLPGAPQDRVDALALVAAVAVETGKLDDAGPVLDAIIAIYQSEGKELPQSSWQMHRVVELCARANKWDKAQIVLDAIKDPSVRAWARLELLRAKLATIVKQKADEQFLEPLADTPGATPLAAALARTEVARHNAVAGESGYVRTVEAMPKGTIRPFGYAGTALGRQDRSQK